MIITTKNGLELVETRMVEQRKSKERIGSIVHKAQEISGYEHLRPGQESALRAISSGYDTLVIMPTGSGKSFIYQAAGNLIAGPTIVISPLIALQRDQAHVFLWRAA